jgi:hypothetical protein
MSIYKLPVHVRTAIDKLKKYFYGMGVMQLRKNTA